VLVTISDKKLAVDSDGNGVVDYYNADVVTASDYYPFGSQMPGRKFSQANSSYRYGFNGKENDKDAGEGIQDYGLRIYDTRLGKFLSVDPLSAAYPFYSPYQFAGNDVLRCIDLDGAEPTSRTEAFDKKSTSFIYGGKGIDVYDRVQNQLFEAFGVKDPNTGIVWIVAHDASDKWFYLKNDNGSTNRLASGLLNGERVLMRGHFERFETQNERDTKSGAAIANGIGTTVFGIAAVVAALPALAAAGSGGAAWVAGSGESGATILSAALGDGVAAYGTTAAGVVVGGAAAYGASGEATAVEGMLQNNAVVVRGGIATEEAIISSSAKVHPSGIRGFSVESANGLTAEELSRARTVPNGKMNVTTVGDIRAAGGQATPTSGGSPNHATVSGLNPAQAVKVLGSPVTNPNPAPKVPKK
jgi:RHS repeat-associated protein